MHYFQSLIFCVCTSRTFFIFLRILSTTLLHVIIDDIIFIEKKILSLSLSLSEENKCQPQISHFLFHVYTPSPSPDSLFFPYSLSLPFHFPSTLLHNRFSSRGMNKTIFHFKNPKNE